MLRMSTTSMFVLTAVGGLACGQKATGPEGDTLLESLAFATAEVAVGEPLILMARAVAGHPVPTQPITLRVSSGAAFEWRLSASIDECVRDRMGGGIAAHMATRQCWGALSANELAYLISIAEENRVFIGFKEAERATGVDAQGNSLTSAETVGAMTQWIQEQGVTILREFILLPGAACSMPPDADLVRAIRGHANIDYLEPDVTGTFLRDGRHLWTVLPTADARSPLGALRPGDVVTAEYRQPDGTVMMAQIALKQR
jgi:hypothetical protein